MALVVFVFAVIALIFGMLLPLFAGEKDKGKAAFLAKWVRVIGIIIMIISFITASVRTIPAGHRGILLRFGAVQGVMSEGLHFIVPGINNIERVEVRTQKETSNASAASKDMQTVETSVAINYHIDPDRVGDLFKNVGTDYRARIIDPAVQESLKQVTAQYTAEELIKQRASVKLKLETEVTNRLKSYNIVVEPLGVSITNFNFSAEFNTAIEAKQVAQQSMEKQKYVLQQAELERKTAVTTAKGEAEAVRIKASALKTQGGSKALAREWIAKWDGKLPVVSGTSSNIVDLRQLMNDKEPISGK